MAIIKRGKDTYQLEVYLGSNINGKPIRHTKTVHCNKREAEREYARFVTECEDGKVHTQSPTTVSEVAESYLKNYSARYKKKTTQSSDRGSINNWINKYLGNAKITKIKKFDIQEWVNTMEDEGQSPKSIRNHFSLLRSIFNYAIDLDLMEQNPCINVRLPKKVQNEARSYTSDEVATLLTVLDKVDNYKFKCFILLGLFGGFRRGEIRGFNWEDLKGNTITISRTRYGDKSDEIWEDTPKTDTSSRTVTLPQFILDDLEKLKIEQSKEKLACGEYYINSPAMIRDEVGYPIRGSRVYKWFAKFCKDNNLPQYGLHSLRHTHASLLVNIGANDVDVSKRLGHSQVSTTRNIYLHLFENKDDKFATQLEEFKAKIQRS